MHSLDNKKKIVAPKANLKHSWSYKDVYIHSDQSKEKRMLWANLKSQVNAYRTGESNIRGDTHNSRRSGGQPTVMEAMVIGRQNQLDIETVIRVQVSVNLII